MSTYQVTFRRDLAAPIIEETHKNIELVVNRAVELRRNGFKGISIKPIRFTIYDASKMLPIGSETEYGKIFGYDLNNKCGQPYIMIDQNDDIFQIGWDKLHEQHDDFAPYTQEYMDSRSDLFGEGNANID